MIADPSGELLSRPQSPGEKNSYESDQTDHVKCPSENYVVGHTKDAIPNHPFAGQSLVLCEGLGSPSVAVRANRCGHTVSNFRRTNFQKPVSLTIQVPHFGAISKQVTISILASPTTTDRKGSNCRSRRVSRRLGVTPVNPSFI